MAISSSFGMNSFITRFIFAIIVVFLTYNPESRSYYHWIEGELPEFSVLKAFAGVALLICWVVLLRATIGSLGLLGIVLATAFFGLLTWLIIDKLKLDTDSTRLITYIIEVMLASVLSIGVSWSHVRRRLTGQIDTDEVDRDI